MTEENPSLNKIAIILDNEVVQILNADDQFAALLLSNPVLLDVTDVWDIEPIAIGTQYNPETNQLVLRPTFNGNRTMTVEEVMELGSHSPE